MKTKPLVPVIFLRTKNDGSKTHSFTLSRAYKKDGEDMKYSTDFYPRNGEALAEVATKAALRCEALDSELEASNEKKAA